MSTLAHRLEHALAIRGKIPADLAKAVGKTESAVSQWLSGETKSMRSDNLMAVCEFLKCNPGWLSSNKGASGLPDSPEKAIFTLDSAPRSSSPDTVNLNSRPDDNALVIRQFDTGGAMGHGVVLQDQPGVIESWRVSPDWIAKNVKNFTTAKNLCIVTGFGDSMRPMYNPGDPLLVDIGVKSVEFDAVYFFRVADEGFVKRLQRIPGQGMVAISENAKYKEWTITKDMDFQVFGRVVKVWRGEEF